MGIPVESGRVENALVGKPRKTSENSHIPTSKDDFGKGGGRDRKSKGGKRPSREGRHRPLAEAPDKTERVIAAACCHYGTDAFTQAQHCRHRYDHIDLPPIRSIVTRVELYGGQCRGCGRRYRTAAPTGMAPGTPFGPGIHSLPAYLHHSNRVGFERLSRIAHELFGLVISEGAIANAFRRMGTGMATATKAITDKPLTARVIARDGATTRTNGITIGNGYSCRTSPSCTRFPNAGRARLPRTCWAAISLMSGSLTVMLAREHQVCLAHVLRDVQYAVDCGDRAFAPKIRDHLRWAIRIGKRRESLMGTTLVSYAAKADNGLIRLMRMPIAHTAGKVLLKAWRGKFFVFLTNRKVPANNNISEREIRPSVEFRKVTNCFRSDWGAQIHAGYRAVTGTARLSGQSALSANRDFVDGKFVVA